MVKKSTVNTLEKPAESLACPPLEGNLAPTAEINFIG